MLVCRRRVEYRHRGAYRRQIDHLEGKNCQSGMIRSLVLMAKPLKLAEETVGHCSYFEGRAPWLRGLTTFVADGKLQDYQGQGAAAAYRVSGRV